MFSAPSIKTFTEVAVYNSWYSMVPTCQKPKFYNPLKKCFTMCIAIWQKAIQPK